jgi:hypothetical protein
MSAADVPDQTAQPFSITTWRSAGFNSASICLSTSRTACPSAFSCFTHEQSLILSPVARLMKKLSFHFIMSMTAGAEYVCFLGAHADMPVISADFRKMRPLTDMCGNRTAITTAHRNCAPERRQLGSRLNFDLLRQAHARALTVPRPTIEFPQHFVAVLWTALPRGQQ